MFLDGIESPSHATEVKITFDILIKNNLIQLPNSIQRSIFNHKDSAGLIGRWILGGIINGYLNQNKFITKVIGSTNCSRIWNAYFRDTHSFNNHFHAISALIFAEVSGTKSKLSSLGIRLKRLYHRLS